MAFFKKKAPKVYPEWLIVGLGNPGAAYKHTRHNVGFDLVDRLADAYGIKVNQTRQRALVGEGTVAGTPVALVKPLTFMNLSGQSVGPLARQYNIPPEKILVVADDLDLDVGRVRMRMNGSPGGHNGHKSMVQALKTQEYPRLKIGIGKGGETTDHVLTRFRPEERVDIDAALTKCVKVVETLFSDGAERAMTMANTKD